MRDWQRRIIYLVGMAIVIVMGLASRRYGPYLPVFVEDYAGDTLWGLMVLLGISVMALGARVSYRGGIAMALACAVEVSQLYHAPWIDALRHTTLGGLVLGYGFVWTDLVCYATGISIGVVTDYLVFSRITADSQSGRRGGGVTKPLSS